MSDAEELSREKERTKREREKNEEGNGRPPTAAAEIFYELNCAGGFCPRESMCEDQTPRETGVVSVSFRPDDVAVAAAIIDAFLFRGLVR